MIEEKYKQMCATPSDIYFNLPILKKYAEQSESIVELGVRKIVSTWALLAGKPKQMLSVDITHPKDYGANIHEVFQATEEEGIAYTFQLGNSLELTLPLCDMLFHRHSSHKGTAYQRT